jgi:hypothetical protein
LGFVISFSPSPKPLRVKSPWKQLLGSTSDAFNTFIPTDILLITMWPPPVIRWFINAMNYSYRYHKP